MVEEWTSSEEVCLDYINKAISWLTDFHIYDKQLFRVAYSSGDSISIIEAPNTASSIISVILQNINVPHVYLSDIPAWESLLNKANQVPHSIAAAELPEGLPLKSFGPLPLFSTCYLAESLSRLERVLLIPTFAIAIRRILYELYSQQRQQVSRFTRTDPLHPFLLFRCVEALLGFELAAKNAETNEKDVFLNNLLNEDLLKNAVYVRLDSDHMDKVIEAQLAEVYGIGADATEFHNALSAIFDPGAAVPNLLDTGLQALEVKALNNALAELAKHNTKGGTVDSSSLMFSLSVLAEINPARHANLIAQGLKVVLHRCEQGLFRSEMPFHIDKKGRATFVPSVEIANAALTIFLRFIENSSAEDIDEVVAVTRSIQAYYTESYNSVEVLDTNRIPKEIRGWCSDTAPSFARVDSWVTVHVLAFFVRRLSVIRHAKRHHILKKFSWVPNERISPEWGDIVDPDEGLGVRTAKTVIESIVTLEPNERKKSPVFILYGPPGTAKTTLVNGIAKEMGWDLITLSPSDFIAESLDLIEQQSRKIFLDLMNMDECVILLDEMDSLLRDREMLASKSQGSVIEFVVPAFLPKLQQLREHALRNRIAVFFVTNYYETIDRAILRAGRIDTHLLVLPYSKEARFSLVTGMLERGFRKEPDFCNRSLEFIKDTVEADKEVHNLTTFREAEQLVDLIMREIRMGEVPSEEDLTEWFTSLSITPDIYAKRATSAFREVCAVIGRVLNHRVPNSVFTAFTTEAAINFLKQNQHHLRDSSWCALSQKWIKALENELLVR